MNLTFFKYQGTGNDFILMDNRTEKWEDRLSKEQIALLCHRRFGIGADGLMLLSPSPDPALDFRMIYYNSDGGESTMCGNGGRCLVAFARRMGIEKERYRFQAVDGIHEAYFVEDEVRLSMMRPQGYRQLSDHDYWIDTGSPHFVRFSETAVGDLDVYGTGKTIRNSDAYTSIGGTNVNFVNRLDANHLRVRTYERGVENETFSCGTGVTACAYVNMLQAEGTGDQEIRLDTPGGSLHVAVEGLGSANESVWLQGPAVCVFEGEIPLISHFFHNFPSTT